MKKFATILATATLFSAMFSLPALATSGACSGHLGVNCNAGADYDGSVICNDGWRNSSVSYSSMVMCGGSNSAPTYTAPQATPPPNFYSLPLPDPTPSYNTVTLYPWFVENKIGISKYLLANSANEFYLVDFFISSACNNFDISKGSKINSDTSSISYFSNFYSGSSKCEVLSYTKLNLFTYRVSSVPEYGSVVLEKKNGDKLSVNYGTGCTAMYRYVGKDIDIDISGLYLDGIGDRIYLFNDGVDCKVFDVKPYVEPTIPNYNPPSTYNTTAPVIYNCDSYGSGAEPTADNMCHCKSGYAWNTGRTQCVALVCGLNSSPINNACVCNDGFVFSNTSKSCVNYDTGCHEQYGPFSFAPDRGHCRCMTGYQWSENGTSCIPTPLSAPTSPPPSQQPTPQTTVPTASVVPAIPTKRFLTTTRRIYVRAAPSAKGKILGTTVIKKQYEALGEAMGWVRVQYGAKVGWIMKSLATIK